MAAGLQPTWPDRFPVRFAAWFAPGIATFMLLLWVAVISDIPAPRWFPQEGTTLVIAGLVWAVAAAVFAGWTSWRDAAAAGLIAGALHFSVYFLPLVFLLGAPASSSLVLQMAGFLCGLLLAYAAVLVTFFLILSRNHRSKKGQP